MSHSIDLHLPVDPVYVVRVKTPGDPEQPVYSFYPTDLYLPIIVNTSGIIFVGVIQQGNTVLDSSRGFQAIHLAQVAQPIKNKSCPIKDSSYFTSYTQKLHLLLHSMFFLCYCELYIVLNHLHLLSHQ